MIFELMSNGSIVNLQQTALPAGIPDISYPRVVLLLPYNRYLLGHSMMRSYERWIWGKPSLEPKEIFLYEDEPQTLTLDELTKITISTSVIERIRASLLQQMQPPGEHLAAALILRGVLKDYDIFKDDGILSDEQLFAHVIEKDALLNMAYWGVRFALFRNEFESVARIKTWLKSAGEIFDSNECQPRVWFSLTPLPAGRELAEMETMSFSLDDLQRMISQSSLPVVLFSKAGYLVLSDFGNIENVPFRIWTFLPAQMWNELRERRKLSIRDLVLSVWGYCDALQASIERTRYAPLCENVLRVF